MGSKLLTIVLLAGIMLLVALSIANLIVSKRSDPDINRLVAVKVAEVLQSKEFEQSINAAVSGGLSKANIKAPTSGQAQVVVGPQGVPGVGINGKDGVNGVNGKDGKDGKDGPKGDQGAPGKTLELRWSLDGILQTKYTTDDFWIDVSKESLPQL